MARRSRSHGRGRGRGAAAAVAALCLATTGPACGPPGDSGAQQGPASEPQSGTLTLLAPPAQDLLPGSLLQIAGTGFQPQQRATMHLSFTGTSQLGAQSREIKVELPFTYQSATALTVAVDAALHKALAGAVLGAADSATLSGTLSLTFELDRSSFTRTAPASFVLRAQLSPALGAIHQRALYLEDRLLVEGGGLLLPGEGQSVLVLEGAFAREVYAGQVGAGLQYTPYPRREFALAPVSRSQAALPIHATVLGIAPGTFTGKATLVNRHASGVEIKTDAVNLEIALLRTQLSALNSPRISRGQRIVGLGAGFLPLDPAGDTATLVLLRGTFTVAITPPVPPIPIETTLVTAVVDGNHLLFVARPMVTDEGTLMGLGGTPGRFVGSLVPLVVHGAEQQEGAPLPCGSECTLDVVPPKQVLFAKFLPNFTEGLRRFGLRNLELEVREQALLVARRTYAQWNVEIRDSRPDDYDEFTTMEVGGPDPNDAGLFGLDNTDGLDRGNLRLNDYIGGFNATAEVEGSYAFGGVFIESFLSFSPKSGKKNMLSTPLFDQIFAAFVPELGGRAADRSELSEGPRKDALAEAVRVLGTLVGNTLAHEFGHSLGMAVGVDGSHNLEDNDRELMDAGAYRSFAERAEIGEYRDRPSGFFALHQQYLSQILPK